MREEVAVALIQSIEEELKLTQPLRGPRGLRGQKGSPFDFNSHQEKIFLEVLSRLKSDPLFLENLKGDKGDKGSPGEKVELNEILSEVEPLVVEAIRATNFDYDNFSEDTKEKLKLKFTDLSEQEKEELQGPKGTRGPRGQRGKPGEVTPEQIKLVVDENVELLKGEAGQDGKDATLEDIQQVVEENQHILKGPRGLRGQKGKTGETGQDGKDVTVEDIQQVVNLNTELLRGPMGLPGLPGVMGLQGLPGLDGQRGQDGEDAPEVIDIELLTNSRNDEIAFRFKYSDGSSFLTNYVKLPELKQRQNVYISGGGASASKTSFVELMTANYTIERNSGYFEQTVAGITTFLPNPVVTGATINISNYSNGNGVVDGNGNNILGNGSLTIKKDEVFTLLWNGSDWKLV